MPVIEITNSNFEAEVLNSNLPVLVDFWAGWCGPCRMIGPVVEEIAKEKAGTLKVGKVNVDEQTQLAAQFGVMSIPTLVLFNNGEAVNKSVGVKPKEAILDMLNA